MSEYYNVNPAREILQRSGDEGMTKWKKRLRRTCKYLAKFQQRHSGYLPEYLLDMIVGISTVKERLYASKIIERRYPTILEAIRAWETNRDPEDASDNEPGHLPETLKIKARGMSIQRKSENERMFV
jgi:hypothetical protein